MDFSFSVNQLQALSNLLTPAEQEEEDLEEQPEGGAIVLQPGQIGPPKRSNPTDSSTVEPTNDKTIWAEDDVPEGSEFEDIWDTRQQPEYEILFKQSVGTEDVFLGMSRKDGSTACCEDMVRISKKNCLPCGNPLKAFHEWYLTKFDVNILKKMWQQVIKSLVKEIKIKLPDCKPADLTLDVKERFLGLRSSVYKLGLHLPHPVDHKNGRAQFHSDTHTLEVTLTMKREYDFINFA
ncbi:protein PIH1D3 isoform X2 [Pristis pectinata]|uniref:protein PIH1D3 isoform X2 n=1 Tax=Pristis pectinata TaxID=685728 RepID=UPI00223DB7D2|nr:protein PIH1D3 isoform X2 [Pristis pectinata]